MSFFISKGQPNIEGDQVSIKPGGKGICVLFLVTIVLAISFENFLGIPPFMGMMTGLSLLMFYTYLVKVISSLTRRYPLCSEPEEELDIYKRVARAEWDTLLFFFGVIFSVGGLRYLGHLELVSQIMYTDLGATWTHIAAGLLSSIVDNIPVMFAVLGMDPQMDTFQWLLITLTAGVGGSLFSVGSAAGVALMGRSKGCYTFLTHLRWSWVIAVGYFASIGAHFIINSS